ncbi:Cytidine deaminase [Paraconexibacter sp. AEG42_29]|uniref:Cytidine deaminase n=1 Tax=Paraconexibacter sp. AEG42_29 TaxID=2997339 RepID=A0AAU7ASU4_9ACTN
MPPARNVELKAHDPDPEATHRAAIAFGAADAGTLTQRDTYFPVPRGRLKLREQDGTTAQLIAYHRADAATARTSSYDRIDVPDPDTLIGALRATHGPGPVVRKERRLLLWENVRIHLDDVAGLGRFVELEAVAADDAGDLDAEHRKVADLRAALGIADDRIVAEGYAQLLTRVAAPDDLIDGARVAMGRAYVPYSHFRVGAALRSVGDAATVHLGANVENAAYPQTQCAEASAIGALIAAGGTRIAEVAVMADTPLITPCGGCRQRLAELAGPDTPVHLCGPEGVRQTVTLAQLLPYAFDAAAMESGA